MRKLLFVLVSLLMTSPFVYSQRLFPDSETAKSEVELGVEGIQRLCPTGMWDSWTFRDILFDRESNTVVFVIQFHSWSEQKEEMAKQATEDFAEQQSAWIVSNFKKGYEGLIENPSIQCDGDFMLYMSVGTLLKQMEKDGAKLRIMLLKPDYANQVFGDIPLELTSEQLKELNAKE